MEAMQLPVQELIGSPQFRRAEWKCGDIYGTISKTDSNIVQGLKPL
jgi:hypothetical protein